MKVVIYYLLLLILIALTAGYVLSNDPAAMSMQAVVSLASILVVYTIGISLVGELGNTDEREIHHRNWANRVGLIAGTTTISIGIMYQLFTHHLDWWLLSSLIVINLSKIIALVYANYKK